MDKIIIIIGSFIVLLGCIGFVRLTGFFTRVQLLSKSISFGIATILFGVFMHLGFDGMGIRALVCVFFVWFLVSIIVFAITTTAEK